MKNLYYTEPQNTCTLVDYLRNGQVVQHRFREVLARPQVEQRMLMQFHIPARDILEIDYE